MAHSAPGAYTPTDPQDDDAIDQWVEGIRNILTFHPQGSTLIPQIQAIADDVPPSFATVTPGGFPSHVHSFGDDTRVVRIRQKLEDILALS